MRMLSTPQSKGNKMYSIQRKFLQRLSAACPLCGLTARGGDLCAGCSSDLAAYLDSRTRCEVCFEVLLLSSAPVASAEPRQTADTSHTSHTPHTPHTPHTADRADRADTAEPLEAPGYSAGAPAVRCSRCQRCPPAYSSLVAAIEYAYPGAMLIQHFKEGARLAHAGLLARLLWGRLRARAASRQHNASVGVLVPIPSSQSGLRRRGFNPAGELARELARLSGYPLRQEWLIRTRETSTQKTLDARARRNSVDGLYVCPHAVPPVWVGVVDDVVTTGSTMDTAARALLVAGAAGVIALAAAHTPRTWQNDTYD